MDLPTLEPNLYTVKAIILLDNDGRRILAQYYEDANTESVEGLNTSIAGSFKEQRAFEKQLFAKTSKNTSNEILLLDGLTCVYKSNVDVLFYVVGAASENELMLVNVLNCVYESVSLVLRKNVERKMVFEHLDGVMLAIDEIVDRGVVLEADPAAVAARVALRPEDIPIGEQTVAQVHASFGARMAATSAVFQSAKEQLKWSLLK